MLTYRRELDGLRTLAVIAVIIYHANMTIGGLHVFKGGFFGVDIFLVLSGYLITGIIRGQMENNTFSLFHFYWSRVKRIVPALLIMLVFSSLAAYIILTSAELVVFAKSLQSVLYFGSNYFFFYEDSYTALASIYKPLLHTWSLALEWQFYILYPLIVWAINKFYKRYMFSLLLSMALLSLIYADYIVTNNPDMAFYLLPSRVWELILGGLVTFSHRDSIEKLKEHLLLNLIYKALPLIGLLLIIHSLMFIDHHVNHPSFYTVIPVLGTCLILMFAHRGDFATDFLSTKVMVYIGLISYSLYLWHQPIFVFFRVLKYDYFRYEQFILLIFIATILSVLTYRLVEGRDSRNRLGIKSFIIFISLYVGLVIFAHKAVVTGGYTERFGDLSYLSQNIRGSDLNIVGGVKCQHQAYGKHCDSLASSDKTLLVVGDSNAGALGYTLANYAENKQWRYAQLSSAGCSTLPGVYRNGHENALKAGRKPKPQALEKDELCNNNADALFEFVKSYRNVSLVYNVTKYRFGKNSDEAIQSLNKLASMVDELILIYPFPTGFNHLQRDLLSLKSKQKTLNALSDDNYKSISYTKATGGKATAYTTLNSVLGDNVFRFYPEKYLCDKKKCITHDEKNIYYVDRWHLSIYGTDVVLVDVIKHLNNINR